VYGVCSSICPGYEWYQVRSRFMVEDAIAHHIFIQKSENLYTAYNIYTKQKQIIFYYRENVEKYGSENFNNDSHRVC